MNQYLSLIILATVGLIFLVYGLLGWWNSRGLTTPHQFFLADRKLKPPGFVGTLISTNAAVANVFFLFVVYGYLFGVGVVFWAFAFWSGSFLIFWWLLKTGLKSEIRVWDTLHEFLASRFFGSKAFRISAALTTITCFAIALSSEVVIGSNIFRLFTSKGFSGGGEIGIGVPVALAFVVAVYISLGGFKTCARTDLIQAVLVTIALIPLARWSVPYLWAAGRKATLADLTLIPKFWHFGVFTLLSWMAWSPVAMDMWQRCTAVERREVPLKWIPISLLWLFGFSVVPVAIGVAMKVISAQYETMPALSFLEHLLKTHSGTIFGSVFLVLIFVGLTAGILSTVDTFLLVCSQSLVTDVVAPLKKWPRIADLDEETARRCLFLGRLLVWVIPLICVPAFFVAIQLGSHMVLIFNYAAYSCPLVLLPMVLHALCGPATRSEGQNEEQKEKSFKAWCASLRRAGAATFSAVIAFAIVIVFSFKYGLAVRDHPEVPENWDRVYSIPVIALASSTLLYVVGTLAANTFRRSK